MGEMLMMLESWSKGFGKFNSSRKMFNAEKWSKQFPSSLSEDVFEVILEVWFKDIQSYRHDSCDTMFNTMDTGSALGPAPRLGGPAPETVTVKQGKRKEMIEGSLEVKLPTRWTDEKAKVGRVREEKRREEESISEKRKSQKKEDAAARKGRKVAIHCFFSMICGSRGSKSRLARAAGAEPSGRMRAWKIARCCGAKHICKWKS